ncbi:MAG: response regulator [Alphaproteobacteria bacterium]|nr:response regulator [Alphaproteobacteria bacterium]
MRAGRVQHLALIADDDFFIRNVVMKTLNGLCNFIETHDGAHLIELYKEHMPDIVFLDVHLPHVNGIDLVQKIKKIDPDAFIVMLTSDSTQENLKRSMINGAAGFISKPFIPRTVLANFKRCPFVHSENEEGEEASA